jgi:hypothetical protein
VRTGCGKAHLVGYATIAERITYRDAIEFAGDYARHRVATGSAYDAGPSGKIGYLLTDVEAVSPRPVTARVESWPVVSTDV